MQKERITRMLERYFIKFHTLLIALYAISTVVNYSELNQSLFFYPRYILSQPWVMFSPDPQSSTSIMSYRCGPTGSFSQHELFLTFWEKQNGAGKRKAQLLKTVYLATIKKQRIQNKTNKPRDTILLNRAEELIKLELRHLCPNIPYTKIEVRYDQFTFLSQQ